MGRIQLGRRAAWTARRTEIATRLTEMLEAFPGAIRIPRPVGMQHAYYRLYAYVCPEGLRPDWDRDRIVAEVVSRGVPLSPGRCSEVYLENAFDATTCRPGTTLQNPLQHREHHTRV